MDKKMWLKILIIIFSIIIIAILVTLYLLNQNNINNEAQDIGNNTDNVEESDKENVEEIIDSEVKIVDDRNIFYTVAECVQMYLNYSVDKDTKIICNLLDSKYKEEFDINEENVLSKIETYDRYKVFRPKKIYQKEQDESITEYFVYGTIRDETNAREISINERQETDLYLSVKLNYGESIYTVVPNGYQMPIEEEINSNN